MLSVSAHAELKVFEQGEVLTAEDLNANFAYVNAKNNLEVPYVGDFHASGVCDLSYFDDKNDDSEPQLITVDIPTATGMYRVTSPSSGDYTYLYMDKEKHAITNGTVNNIPVQIEFLDGHSLNYNRQEHDGVVTETYEVSSDYDLEFYIDGYKLEVEEIYNRQNFETADEAQQYMQNTLELSEVEVAQIYADCVTVVKIN